MPQFIAMVKPFIDGRNKPILTQAIPAHIADLRELIDLSGRRIDYLRISVTDRCDLRCSYCLPKGFKGFEEPAHWLTFDEIVRLVFLFASLGTKRIRLTGGEPLLRRNLVHLVEQLVAVDGIEDLSLSTNATQLARHAEALFKAGMRRLNVSLDSLVRSTVEKISGNDCLGRILDGLMTAKAVGFPLIKINMVPLLDVNQQDIFPMAQFCQQHGFVLRLIEAMPMGETGRAARGVNLAPILAQLTQHFDLLESTKILGGGPARYWESRDGRFTLGLITPISQHFCATCNRVRLAVDGTLYPCLGQEQSFLLRPLLRNGASDAELTAAIRRVVDLKPERHEFIEKPTQVVRFMSVTGG